LLNFKQAESKIEKFTKRKVVETENFSDLVSIIVAFSIQKYNVFLVSKQGFVIAKRFVGHFYPV